jgi:hypothetical protein
MEGLGDLVAKVTEVTGIKAVVEAVAGKDCGCAQRQAKLNDMFPFNTPKHQQYIDKMNNARQQETNPVGEAVN